MMYSNQLAVAIKHNGKVLRENKDIVYLPFGSEFSILVKNLNSRRAKFRLYIDGIDALDGTSIIVNANSEIEMKRFIRNGNMNEGNAFKFIERTKSIEDSPRGIRIDDGIVRVEFWFEKEKPNTVTTIHTHYDYYDKWYRRYSYPETAIYTGIAIGQVAPSYNSPISGSLNNVVSSSKASSFSEQLSQMQSTTADTSCKSDLSDVGITVPGSVVEQKFNTVYGFDAELNSSVIVLHLVGKTASNDVIVEPITVKTKNVCSTCSRTNKSNAKFCVECGTSLQIV